MAHIFRKFRNKWYLKQNQNKKPIFEHLEPRLLLNADMQGLLAELQPIDPLESEASTDAIEIDVTTNSGTLAASATTYTPQSVPYSQNFDAGLPTDAQGWEYYSSNEGRIQVVGGRLRMDDSVGNGTYSLNEAILHVDLTGQTNVNLSLDHYSIYDENHTLASNFTGHSNGDGIAISIDGTNWIKISGLTGSSTISIDLDLVSLFGGSADLSDVRIKFQQYDNYPSPTDDGREFDNIQITPITTSIVVQSIPYSQDFESGLPDESGGWEYYSSNEGRIQIVGGRLRMDDSVGNGTYSLNEAILHLDLTGQTNVNLSLDHYSIYDENHTMPTNFTGHYKADGIAVSIDGTNWIKISDLTGSSAISIDLDLVSLFGGSADLSNVRIKFQQYDNWPSPTDDGREFDNIQVHSNLVFDLNNWTENLMADDTAGGGFVINSATTAETISGGLTRAALFSGTNDVGYMLEGQFKVKTAFDDDFIGFVVGYNNNDHVSGSADYILIDWKQANNDVDFGAGTVTGYKGLALSTVSGATAGEIQGNTYAWAHSGPVTEQLRANTLGSTGWNDEQMYDFKLVYLPGCVQLFINGTLELDYKGAFSDGSIGLYQFSQRQVEFSNLSLFPIQTVPYSQDFSSGLPDASNGWEYYSDNDGRIQVVGGRLRMDDSVGDGTYSLNEAILHLNLVGQTNVNLSLDHYSIFDENHTLAANFTGHANGDGIAISIDGTNWIKIFDLTGSSAISIDLDLVSLFGPSADLSDVRIKFQQYDNYPSPTDDGREFDNIQVTAISSGIVAQSIPYSQDFSSGLPDASGGWEYYSDNDGRIQIVGGRLRMDDSVGNGTYSLNEAILHVDLTGQTNVNLSLDHYSIYDENNTMPANFTGHYKADGIAVSIDGLNWIKVSALTGSSAISIDLDLLSLFGPSADLSNVRIKFQQYDNWPSPTDDGREFDNIHITPISSGIVVQSIPYTQDFESTLPDASGGWEYYSENDGRIQIVGGRLRMDDSVGDSTYSLNEAILHVDLTGQINVNLSLDHYSIYDENHTMPANFTGHYKADGIAVSIDGFNWIKVSALTGSSAISIDLDLVSLFGPSADLSDVRIKFQQYDNYPSPTDDGREFDNIQITSNLVVQSVPYSQDFSSGLPDISDGWEYYSNNEGRIFVVGGRLRMDDSVDNSIYSLNEAILHVNFTGKTNFTLSFDHWRGIREDTHLMPSNFSGHYNADGIAVSVDGTIWIKVSDLGDASHISKNFDLVSAFGVSADLSNVRIKFQQYDNGSLSLKGHDFYNIQITAGIAQPVPYSQDFDSGLPTNSEQGWEYYSSNDGRIQVVGGRLRMDDSTGDGTYSLNEAILHVNLTDKTNLTLSLDHYSIFDENHTMPANFTGHANGDGIAISIDGLNWIKVSDLTGSSHISLDLDLVSLFGASADLSDFRIKFQQYDNYPSPTDDGREFDNIQVTADKVSVYFADPNLKAAVEAKLGISDPFPIDMLKLTKLEAWDKDIFDLTGLEYAKNLTELYLYNNQISDVSPLSDLANLEILHLNNNQINNIDSLSGLANLLGLHLSDNQISDISSLSGLINLKFLYLHNNQIDNISSLSGLTRLSELDLSGNHVSNISAISGMTGMLFLYLSGNQIGDISSLSGLTKLWVLNLNQNLISDISPISGMTDLSNLNLSDNQISDISALTGLHLWHLHLNNNQISDISVVSGMTGLLSLGLSNNWISNIYSLSGLTNLQSLSLSGNQIWNIAPLSGLTGLWNLYLSNNQIDSVGALWGLIGLQRLDLSNNQISSITPLSALLGLDELYLQNNQVSDISPLSQHDDLTDLDLRINPLNGEAYSTYIPMIQANNPGINLFYDPA